MAAKNSRLSLNTFSLPLSLGLLLVPHGSIAVQTQPSLTVGRPSNSWEISQAFSPPNRGAPASSTGGGARSDCVSADRNEQPFTALLPGNSLALTVTDEPTFYVYVPPTKARTAEFLLRDKEGNDLYRTTVPLPSQPGIFGIKLPKNGNKTVLEAGKDYQWLVALVCKPEDRRDDVFVTGWIQRMNPSITLTNQLQAVNPEEQAGIYAKAGIWFEAVNTLAELRRERPSDSTLAANWEALLKSVDLEEIADKPLVQ